MLLSDLNHNSMTIIITIIMRRGAVIIDGQTKNVYIESQIIKKKR